MPISASRLHVCKSEKWLIVNVWCCSSVQDAYSYYERSHLHDWTHNPGRSKLLLISLYINMWLFIDVLVGALSSIGYSWNSSCLLHSRWWSPHYCHQIWFVGTLMIFWCSCYLNNCLYLVKVQISQMPLSPLTIYFNTQSYTHFQT